MPVKKKKKEKGSGCHLFPADKSDLTEDHICGCKQILLYVWLHNNDIYTPRVSTSGKHFKIVIYKAHLVGEKKDSWSKSNVFGGRKGKR